MRLSPTTTRMWTTMTKKCAAKMKGKTKEMTDQQKRNARWTEPFLAETHKMSPEELARFEKVQAAHRAALKGNFEPGRELGLFPKKSTRSG